jgi:hypothetical protein
VRDEQADPRLAVCEDETPQDATRCHGVTLEACEERDQDAEVVVEKFDGKQQRLELLGHGLIHGVLHSSLTVSM